MFKNKNNVHKNKVHNVILLSFIFNFEHISHFLIVFLLLTLNM